MAASIRPSEPCQRPSSTSRPTEDIYLAEAARYIPGFRKVYSLYLHITRRDRCIAKSPTRFLPPSGQDKVPNTAKASERMQRPSGKGAFVCRGQHNTAQHNVEAMWFYCTKTAQWRHASALLVIALPPSCIIFLQSRSIDSRSMRARRGVDRLWLRMPLAG